MREILTRSKARFSWSVFCLLRYSTLGHRPNFGSPAFYNAAILQPKIPMESEISNSLKIFKKES